MSDVLHVPELSANLLSVNKIVQKGNSCFKNGCFIYNSSEVLIARCVPENGVYKIKNETARCMISKAEESSKIWHRRYGHINYKALCKNARW